LLGLGRPCREFSGTDQIDDADDIASQHAERRFATDFFEAPGKKSSARLDGAEGMLGGIGRLETGAFERILVQVG
jgi:hypothetical protein